MNKKKKKILVGVVSFLMLTSILFSVFIAIGKLNILLIIIFFMAPTLIFVLTSGSILLFFYKPNRIVLISGIIGGLYVLIPILAYFTIVDNFSGDILGKLYLTINIIFMPALWCLFKTLDLLSYLYKIIPNNIFILILVFVLNVAIWVAVGCLVGTVIKKIKEIKTKEK